MQSCTFGKKANIQSTRMHVQYNHQNKTTTAQRRVKTKWRKRTGNTHIILNKDKERLRRTKIPRYFKSLAELMHHQERRGKSYVYYKK